MIRPFVAAVVATTVLAGCAGPSATTYSRQDVGRVMESSRGTVIASRPVEIAGESTGLGAAATGLAAGVVGASTIGEGSGSVVAGALLGLVGVVVGAMAEEMLTRSTGVEYTVETEDGRVMTIVQHPDGGEPMPPGTPVQVQFGGEQTRVIAARPATPPMAAAPATGNPPGGAPGAYSGATPPAGRDGDGGTAAGDGTGATGSGSGDWINPDDVTAGSTGGDPGAASAGTGSPDAASAGTVSPGGTDAPLSAGEGDDTSTRQLNIGQLRGPATAPQAGGGTPLY